MQKVRIAAAGAAVAALALGGSLAATAQAADSNLSNAARPAAAKASVSPSLIVPRAFAVVDGTGLLVRGRAAVSAVRLSTGIYDVRFQGAINRCGWSGTVGFGQFPFGGSVSPGSGIAVTGRAGTNNGVFVQTYVGTSPADVPFTVLVMCS